MKQDVKNVSDTVNYSLDDIANMAEESYNHHGWAKINDLLSVTELADFQSKVGENRTKKVNGI